MVGVPYPNVRDPYLIEKEEHFRRLEREGRDNPDIPKINWSSWYLNGTVRAVNQALGRVVRHFKDYGMLFLFDERYE
jgi:regulator of telomere elongation helicase 1